jgi:hypothetical protein
LHIGQDHVLYCRVKGNEHLARFLRPAYYQLTAHVQEDTKTSDYLLKVGDDLFPITARCQ